MMTDQPTPYEVLPNLCDYYDHYRSRHSQAVDVEGKEWAGYEL